MVLDYSHEIVDFDEELMVEVYLYKIKLISIKYKFLYFACLAGLCRLFLLLVLTVPPIVIDVLSKAFSLSLVCSSCN
jgi:hypothetical protein